jgi:hypothetical protein
MPELLADARRWIRTLLPPCDPVEGCEHETGSQRDPTMERGCFCTQYGKSEKQFLLAKFDTHIPTKLPNKMRRNAEASPLSTHELDSGVSSKLWPPEGRKL